MSINYVMGALSALILKQRGIPMNRALAGGAVSAVTPGILGLAIPLAMAGQGVKGKQGTSHPALTGPVTLVELTDVRLESKEDAVKTLEAEGQQQRVKVVVADVQVPKGEKAPPGDIVVKQVPAPEELVPLGGHVTLYVTPSGGAGAPPKKRAQAKAKK